MYLLPEGLLLAEPLLDFLLEAVSLQGLLLLLYLLQLGPQSPLLLLEEVADGLKVVQLVLEGPLALVLLQDFADLVDGGLGDAVPGEGELEDILVLADDLLEEEGALEVDVVVLQVDLLDAAEGKLAAGLLVLQEAAVGYLAAVQPQVPQRLVLGQHHPDERQALPLDLVLGEVQLLQGTVALHPLAHELQVLLPQTHIAEAQALQAPVLAQVELYVEEPLPFAQRVVIQDHRLESSISAHAAAEVLEANRCDGVGTEVEEA